MSKRWFALLAAASVVAASSGWLATRIGSSGAAEVPKPAAAEQESGGAEQITTAVLSKGLITLRVQFGSLRAPAGTGKTPTAPTTWDGQLSVTQGTLHRVLLWKDDPADSIDGQQWKLATRHTTPFTYEQRKRGHEAMAVADAALLVELSGATAQTRLAFKTAQGDFDFALGEVPWGVTKRMLNGLVQVARLPNTTTILSAPSEDDYPAATLGPDGKLYVAYVAFTHGKDFAARPVLDPKSLDSLAEPCGGD
jgi:hypothetical protein